MLKSINDGGRIMNAIDLFGVGPTPNYPKVTLKRMQSAAKSILKVNKTKCSKHPYLTVAQLNNDGKQVVCDGYRAVVLDINLDLPTPTNVEEHIEESTLKYILSNIEKASQNEIELKDLPTIEELKAYIEEHKEEAKRYKDHQIIHVLPYKLTNEIKVNAFFLIDMLLLIEKPRVFVSTISHRLVYFLGENAKGVLLTMKEQ